jgi:hypothetical protein
MQARLYTSHFAQTAIPIQNGIGAAELTPLRILRIIPVLSQWIFVLPECPMICATKTGDTPAWVNLVASV